MKFIAMADLHLRWDVPICRSMGKDEWNDYQEEALRYVCATAAQEYILDIIVAGDIFHRSTGAPSWFMARWLRFFHEMRLHHGIVFWMIPGQHDLPNHDYRRLEDSNLGILLASGMVKLLDYNSHIALHDQGNTAFYGCGYGCKLPKNCPPVEVIVFHGFVTNRDESFPNMKTYSAERLLEKYSYTNFIIAGDNHRMFFKRRNTTTLINCGPMTIQNAEMAEADTYFYICNLSDLSFRNCRIPYCEKGFRPMERKEEKERIVSSALAESLLDNQATAECFKEAVMTAANNLAESMEKEIIDLLRKAFEKAEI